MERKEVLPVCNRGGQGNLFTYLQHSPESAMHAMVVSGGGQD
jgi:hypothetical protein